MLNSDGKSVKSSLKYKDINVIFFESHMMRIIILNDPRVQGTKKYMFDLQEKYDNFSKMLFTFSLMENPQIKYFEVTNPDSNYQDLFWKNPLPLFQKFKEDGTIKAKMISKDIEYVIDHENFLKQQM